MSFWAQHLPIAPVAVPLVAGATILLFAESRRLARATIAMISVIIQLAVAIMLMSLTDSISVYAIGGWAAPFGIVLVVDRLSAMMLVLTATLALPALVYSFARWDRAGVHYYPLFLLMLMGVNGAFLTGDLFNLFVFFEVFLVASYGLLLHGSGAARVKAGLHYIVVNLLASLLFLIGAAVLYGEVGTLNMADIAARSATLAAQDRGVFDAGLGVLGIAFLIKAGAWPLNFWLPGAYGSAGAPVAAVFSILTKVGIYAVLRVGSLLPESIAFGPFGGEGLFYGGLATMVFGMVGMLTTQRLNRLVAFSVDLIVRYGAGGLCVASRKPYCARAFLHVEFGVRERRLFHADGNDRPHRYSDLIAGRHSGAGRSYLFGFRAGGSAGCASARRRSRSCDSGHYGISGIGIRVLRAASRGIAAAVGFHSEVRDSVLGYRIRIAWQFIGPNLGTRRHPAGRGPRRHHRLHPHRHTPFLERGGSDDTSCAHHRSCAGRILAGDVHWIDRRRRSRDEISGCNGGGTAYATHLY